MIVLRKSRGWVLGGHIPACLVVGLFGRESVTDHALEKKERWMISRYGLFVVIN